LFVVVVYVVHPPMLHVVVLSVTW